MDYLVIKKKKTFKPLILYDDSTSMSSLSTNNPKYASELQNDRQLIEEHRTRTSYMLDHNAQLWEKEGGFFNVGSSVSKKSSSGQLSPLLRTSSPTQFTINNITKQNNHRSGNVDQDCNAMTTRLDTTFRVNTLEPKTQSSIPLPLYSRESLARKVGDSTAKRFDSLMFLSKDAELNNYTFSKTTPEEQDYADNYFDIDEEEGSSTNAMNTTTFIAEPQFHHIYKPHIVRKRRRGNLPKKVTEYLKRWLISHKKHPYPTEREKQLLASETGLMINQISNWFINARRRILQPLLESENNSLLSKRVHSNSPSNEGSFTPSGVNVVGSARNNDDLLRNERSSSERESDANYEPHHHYHYNNITVADTNSLLLDELPDTDQIDETKGQRGEGQSVPPPWALSPTKLPSMNVLEKDLDAFKPNK